MIEEQARVIALEEKGVWVETERRSACGQCSVNNSCGTALLGKILGIKRNKVFILNPEAKTVSVGDQVIIGISEQALTRGSLAIYIMPLFSLFIFALLGEILAEQLSIAGSDLMTSLFGVVGLFFGFLWVRLFSRSVSTDPDYQPLLLRRAGPSLIVSIQH